MTVEVTAEPLVMVVEDEPAVKEGLHVLIKGWGADVEFRSPMAVAVVGGLISSTFLSLLYIPAVFTIIDDIAGFGRRLLNRMFAGQRRLAGESHTPAE